MELTKMKMSILIIVVFFCVTGFTFAEVIEAIVARVNNQIITLSDVKKAEDDISKGLRAQYKNEDEFQQKFAETKKNMIDRLIEQMLLIQEAKKRNIEVEEELNDSIVKLKRENNIETDEQLIEALKSEGLSLDSFKNQIKERIMQQKLLYFYLQGKITITDQELAQYYKENPKEFTEPSKLRLSIISVLLAERTKEEALALAQSILAKIKAGENFSKVAQESSEDPSKDKGGDLGFLTREEMNPKIAQTAFSLKAGENSDIIETDTAYLLYKVVEIVDEKMKDLESAKSDIYTALFNKRSEKYQQEYLTNLRKENHIEIIYNPYKEIPAENKKQTPEEKH